MIPPGESLDTFWEYREFFKSRMRRHLALEAAESSGEYRESAPLTPLNERLIQAIWAHQLLQPGGLRLLDGRPLRILDPGQWNGAGGPDFRGARLMIDSETVSGDVEIHLDASLWRTHRHESDLDYNGCVLHAVYRNDDGVDSDRLHNGTALPRFEMEPYVFPDLESVRRSITPEDFPYGQPAGLGRCHELMTAMDPAVIAGFLDRAGEERLEAKIARLEDQARSAPLDQVFYQSLMMSLGSGSGKSLYYLLAKRAPAAELKDYAGELPEADRARAIEAILLHLAGLIPDEGELADAPAESRAYAKELGRIWKRFEPYWSDRVLAPSRRWYRGIRPVNFPTRRLSAVAAMLDEELRTGQTALGRFAKAIRESAGEIAGLKKTRKPASVLKSLYQPFEQDSTGNFWAGHYSFTAEPAASSMKLIGESTARSLLFNAVLPAVSLFARHSGDAALERDVRKLASIFPTLQPNHVTGFMTWRLFGETGRGKDLISSELRQQGLFQIFHSCCNGEERNCEKCYFLTAS